MHPDFNILIEDGHRHSAQAIEKLNESKKIGLAYPIPSKILSVGLGSKADHPILQTADMLAYSIWQQISHGDLAIYDALHPAAGSLYQPEFIDFDGELVDVVTDGVQKWTAHRKAFGQRKAREIEKN